MPGALEVIPGDEPGLNGAPIEEEVVYEPYVILDQNLDLELNFREQRIEGTSTIKVFCVGAADESGSIALDARQCEIDLDNVTVNGRKVKAEYDDPYKLLDTPKGYEWSYQQHALRMSRMAPLMQKKRAELPMIGRDGKGCMPIDRSLRVWLHPKEPTPAPAKSKITIKNRNSLNPSMSFSNDKEVIFTIAIPFKTRHVRDGLHFVGVEDSDTRYPHVYTRHSHEAGFASCLFPCVDDRSKTHWTVALKFPRTVGDALKQPLATQGSSSSALVNSSSRQGKKGKGSDHRDFTMTEEDKLLEMTAVCSGNLVGEHVDPVDETKKVMQFEASQCGAQHIGFAIGPFEDVDLHSAFRSEEDDEALKESAVKVHGYCLPGRGAEVLNTCAPFAHATDFFSFTFTKYPYDSYKLCFVDDMIEDTVPLQSFSLCSTRLLYPEEVIDTEIEVTRKLIHTLASQYFGIYIVPNKRTDTWIVVGLAYYMTDLFMKKLCGNNYYRFQMRYWSDKLVDADLGRPSLHELGEHLHLGDFEVEFMALKAPLVVFILDRRMLKSSNTAGISRVISGLLREASMAIDTVDVSPFVVSSDKLRKICEKKGRIRLDAFWDQYIMGAGCPRLSITQRFNKKKLEVELIVRQEQVEFAQRPRPLEKDDFWRDLKEERHQVYAGEVRLVFTGPMTFRVHEADGTPYEHLLDIKLDAAATKGSKLPLPYNTKYKRLKKMRQKKKEKELARAAAQARGEEKKDDDDKDEDDGPSINVFGDVLITPEEMAEWKLVDWDEKQQDLMDNESFEWIRADCDFEWICQMKTSLAVYMTVSQLQQDRDIAAQVEAMLLLGRNRPSNIQTTVLLRTLYDKRYYHGIRRMAAEILTDHAHVKNSWRGMWHLMRVFQTFYCFPGTSTPRPNDFFNKQEYMVQAAIPGALALIRGGEDQCPPEARHFILEQLIFNDNENNPYTDHFYVAKLLDALATSLVRGKTEPGFTISDEQKIEREQFLEKALEQIERYRRMDEWACSYQNIWTVTALDCKKKLMKSGVIPLNPLDFVRYLTDETLDLVQIKAFESLIELELMLKPTIMRLLLTTMSRHQSPFVRDRLFKAFCRGLAAIAIGEHKEKDKEIAEEPEDDSGLIIEQDEAVIQQRKADFERKEDISRAMIALKEMLKENKDLGEEIWKAIESPIIGLDEKRNLLEICATIFEKDNTLLVTVEYPKFWTLERGEFVPQKVSKHPPQICPRQIADMEQKCMVSFKQQLRTSLKRKREFEVEPEAPPPPPEQKPPEPKRIKVQPRPSINGDSVGTATVVETMSPAPIPRQSSISVAAPPPLARSDSISVQPLLKVQLPVSASPSPAPEVQVNGIKPKPTPQKAKTGKKRKSDDAQLDGESSRPRKMVTLRYNPLNQFVMANRHKWSASSSPRASSVDTSTIVATPVKLHPPSLSPPVDGPSAHPTAGPKSEAKPVRKPLPSAAPHLTTQSSSPPVVSVKPVARQPLPSGPVSSSQPAASTPTPAPKRPMIKLKLKSSSNLGAFQASPPPPPGA
ncbi:putative tata-binding protein associated factor taf2 protein [Phaeoacremonium minimum UCRPA7]|uniref:Transcription initiation factor TFIID subunit 2 n=1 Tax=Phaeoacremonium minimum (strain UCR-PA7) TaxID=1286976 RepID=R8BN73_PHAM7|nr:putative tata-binding protein associated factor taf2 protein [Phaeoacremonium minimum UCRPA7]EOO00745.1 putative tata-binding protein associated factor taf2 protein [Phaeoacremonium minimum UCRPA7]